MCRGKSHTIIGGAVTLAMVTVVLVLVACQGGTPAAQTPAPAPETSAAQPDASAGAPATAATEPPAAAPPGGPVEGVKVHGEWTIEVRDPDGTLVSHTEFENSLQGGNAALSLVMGRKKTMGLWRIQMGLGDLPCYSDYYGAYSGCIVTEPSSTKTGSHYFKNLTVDVPTTGADAYKVVLSGNFTVSRNYTLREVFTGTSVCDPTATPNSNCENLDLGSFTGHGFSSSEYIPVLAGQQVLVTVKLSFS